jgi:hypothetical protein
MAFRFDWDVNLIYSNVSAGCERNRIIIIIIIIIIIKVIVGLGRSGLFLCPKMVLVYTASFWSSGDGVTYGIRPLAILFK